MNMTKNFYCNYSVGSGHYTAYGSHDGHRYHFNDSTVTLPEEETVVKAKAYILFYVERPDKAASDATASETAVCVKTASELAASDSVAMGTADLETDS